MSLVLYPRQFSWEQVKKFTSGGPPGTEILRDRLPAAAAHGIAFDTWVGQTDHNDHPHNIVFGFEPGQNQAAITDGDYVFLDFAMALGWGGYWKDQGWNTLGRAPFPPAMTAAIDRSALEGILDRISGVSDSTIHDIVNRVPDDYLVPEQREVIIRGLLERRGLTRALLAQA